MNTVFRQSGMTLIELMVASVIGIFLLLGLSTVFVNSSRSQRELEYTGQVVENGRYASDMVYTDIRHAGFYGRLVTLSIAASTPDSCSTTESVITTAVDLPLYGYDANALTTRASLGGHCGAYLTNANLSPGSDVVVVRRASSSIFSGTPTDGKVYIQSNTSSFDIQVGTGSGTVPAKNAENATHAIFKKDGTTGADVRDYITRIYFVAPCTIGNAGNGLCGGSGEDTVPTLKRLTLTDDGSGGTTFEIEPLVEGVEHFQVEYGIDNSPTAEDTTTGETGDGVPDVYKAIPASLTEWSQVVSVRTSMLIRSINTSTGYTDEKSYVMGTTQTHTAAAKNDQYKRHVFANEAQIVNIAGRREIPL